MSKLTLYRIDHCDLEDDDVNRIFILDFPRWEIQLKPDIRGRLFLTHTQPRIPDWLDYLEPILQKKPTIKPIRLLGAVLLVKPFRDKSVIYAATWGTGHFLLKSSFTVKNLGLKTALNLMCAAEASKRKWDARRLRALRTKRIGANTLVMHSQFARFTTLESFPFNTEADQVRSVTGKPTDTNTWGNSVTGGVSLNVRSPESPNNILRLCQQIENTFQLDTYKHYFTSIDNIKRVADDRLIGRLQNQILSAVQEVAGIPPIKPVPGGAQNTLDLLTIAPPALIRWDEVDRFEFRFGSSFMRFDEPTWEKFFSFLKENDLTKHLSPSFLFQDVHLHALNADGQRVESWTFGACLSGEVRRNNITHILDEGSFYAIDLKYLEALNKDIDKIRQYKPKSPLLPARQNEKEELYIDRLTKSKRNSLKMHTATVMYKGATAIEVCDVALKNHVLIHIKRGKSSSSLSHLFAQATVSAKLLSSDEVFRKRIWSRMMKVFGGLGAQKLQDFQWISDDDFKPQQNEIVMAIMTGCKEKSLSKLLPFFSKVNLKVQCEELRKMGYRYSVAQILSA